jgi:uncharacterized protein YndB with AHSA1/START domain
MTENLTPEENAERGYTLTRVYDAPRKLVWAALTEASQWEQWFGGPGTKWENLTLDVREGGSWSGTMIVPDGREIPWFGRYLEVREPEHLVISITDQGEEGESVEKMTIDLVEQGDRTELTLRQSGGNLSDEDYVHAKEGTASFLENMAAVIART